MPRVDYSKTVIYQLKCPTFNDIYVNYTSNLRERKYSYAHPERLRKDITFHETIAMHGGFEKWEIVVLEKYTDCKDANDAYRKVAEWAVKLRSPPISSNFLQSSSTLQNPPKILQGPSNFLQFPPKADCKTCKKCGKKFTRTDNLQRHVSKRCKSLDKPDFEKENAVLREELEKKDERFSQEIEVMKQEFKKELTTILHRECKMHPRTFNKINNMLQNNSNTNIVNNNFTIVELGKEKLSDFFTQEQQIQILGKKYRCLDYLIRKVHFNPKHKQFHNIVITNIHDSLAYKYVEGQRRFVAVQKEDLLSQVFDYRMEDISEFYENCKESMLDPKLTEAVCNFIESMGDDKKALEKRKDMRLIIYNESIKNGITPQITER